MNNDDIYSAPESELTAPDDRKAKAPVFWKRFLITFFWGLPIFFAFVVFTTPKETWFMGAIGSVVFSIICGIIAMLIPVKYKSVFVSMSIFLGLTLAYIVGTQFAT